MKNFIISSLSTALICSSLISVNAYSSQNPPVIAQYFGIWTEQNQTWDQKFRSDTPFDKLNRLYISFGSIVPTNDGHFTLRFDGQESRVLNIVRKVKHMNPTAEIFLTVGGDDGDTSFGGASKDPQFAMNVENFLKRYSLTGIDVDWEQNLVKTDLSNLLQALGTTLHADGYKVTLDVWPNPFSVYDMAVINQYVDQINIMSYGTGLSVASCANSYIREGLLPEKIIGGIESESNYRQFGGTVDTLGVNGSIASKAQYALANGFGGMMGWRMDNDYVENDHPNYPTYKATIALWDAMHSQV